MENFTYRWTWLKLNWTALLNSRIPCGLHQTHERKKNHIRHSVHCKVKGKGDSLTWMTTIWCSAQKAVYGTILLLFIGSSNNMDWITRMGFCLYVTVCWLLFMALITTSWNIDLQAFLHWGGNVGHEPMMNDYDPFICIKNHSSVESLKKGDIGGSV